MNFFLRACRPILTATVVWLFACWPSTAQEDALKRRFQQWTPAEVAKLLNDSAWAKTQAIRVLRRRQQRSVAGQASEVPSAATGTTSVDRQAALGGAEDAVDYRFTLRLRSALPIRQAIVRLVQIESKYDQLQPAQKESIDRQTRELLECPECRDNYVVSVGFGSMNSQGLDLVYDWFRGQTLESLKGYIYLANDHGQRRELVAFIAPKVPGDEAFFYFHRQGRDGKPLFTADAKRLIFRMSDTSASSVTNFSMDVARMVVDGKLQF